MEHTEEQADMKKRIVHRDDGTPLRLGRVSRVENEHSPPEDRPLRKSEQSEQHDNHAIVVPEPGTAQKVSGPDEMDKLNADMRIIKQVEAQRIARLPVSYTKVRRTKSYADIVRTELKMYKALQSI